MKRTVHEEEKLKHGDRRVITRFLFLPVTLPNADGTEEMRWLEQATILQQVQDMSWVYQYGDYPGDPLHWRNKQWEERDV